MGDGNGSGGGDDGKICESMCTWIVCTLFKREILSKARAGWSVGWLTNNYPVIIMTSKSLVFGKLYSKIVGENCTGCYFCCDEGIFRFVVLSVYIFNIHTYICVRLMLRFANIFFEECG